MVWQDFMFANLDYPIGDPDFRAIVESEVDQVLDAISHRPSTTVFCGNSEIEQQVAMLGLDPELGRGELFGDILPERVAGSADAVYLPSAPCGGEMPFSTASGVANYFGVGGYRRGLDDVRRSGVRFASECLAIANVPGEELLEAISDSGSVSPVADPRWKAGVPRDAGSGWDFDDVRDHYFKLLFGTDPGRVRASDPHRYLELSRAVSGEIMSEVFGEWRRPGSSCGGGLVLWWRDRVAGAGWGLCDVEGRPKVALDHLRRVLAPIAVWTTDEGLDGIAVHVANDLPSTLDGVLRVRLFRDGEALVDEAETPVLLAPHESMTTSVESVIGRFVDSGYAYRFGPPPHDVVAVSLESCEAGPLSQSFRFPLGPPIQQQPPAALGIEAEVEERADETVLTVSSRRIAYGVRIHADGFRPSDNAFNLEPGGRRRIQLRRVASPADARGVTLTAVNMAGKATVAARPPAPG